MKEEFRVRFIKFIDGERYPMLLDQEGQPHWYATLYATTQIRNSGQAPNTIAAVLGSLRILFSWSLSRRINLEDRFSKREFLTLQELESIRFYTGTKVEELEESKTKKYLK